MTSPYILISIILFSYSIIGYGIKNKSYILCFLALFSPLLISSINISDNIVYLAYFEIIQKGYDISSYRFEPIYYYFNYIFSFFSNYEFLRAFLIGSGLSIKFIFFKKFGENLPLILLFYFALQFYVDSYLLRTTFAISFFLIASYKRYENKNLYAIIFMILAINSHRSAFFLLPFLLFQNLYISLSRLSIVLVSVFSIFTLTNFNGFLSNNLENIIVPIIKLTGSSKVTLDYYLTYLSSFSNTKSLISGAYILYLLIFLIYVLIYQNKIYDSERKKINLISNGMLNSLIFLLAFRLPMLEKIARYTYIFFPLAIDQIFTKINNKYRYYYVSLISFVLLIGAFLIDKGPFERL